MTNPLGGGGAFSGRRELAPGEMREIVGHDKHGNVVKQCTLVRTTRPYVYDLADAYNQDIPAGSKRWFVDAGDNLRFDDPPRVPVALPRAA